MTKKQVEEIAKRYPYIACAVKKNQGVAEFVSGGRKRKIPITEEVKAVCDIIDDIYLNTENIWIRKMIEGFKAGRSDISLIHDMPWERNAFYERKRKLIDKIYNCCVSLQLVDYYEILNEEIA